MACACASRGFVVQDYLNADSVLGMLPQEAHLEREGYQFVTRKYRTDTHIIKDIEVLDSGEKHVFQEQVRIFDLDTLVALHQGAGLKVLNVFGNDQLGDFDAKTSPRMVVVSQKR
jgi:hypothetical protein